MGGACLSSSQVFGKSRDSIKKFFLARAPLLLCPAVALHGIGWQPRRKGEEKRMICKRDLANIGFSGENGRGKEGKGRKKSKYLNPP